VNYFVAVTDNRWYDFLSRIQPDELNFWRPSGMVFKSIEIGQPFLFKLHSPLNYIVGGGFYIRSEKLPLSLAWEAFLEKNGAPSLAEFRRSISSHRKTSEFDPEIGCTVLNAPFFFPRESWIPVPASWSKNIVTGKSFNTFSAEGWALWSEVSERMHEVVATGRIREKEEAWERRFGKEYLTRSRLGQGAFRLLVTSAYQRRCAVTGEKTLPALEAAHIRPFNEEGPNRISNGLLLRSDLHRLFDQGYMTITPEHTILVSRKIREEFENGRDYYAFKDRSLLILPSDPEDQPEREYLAWHNDNRYRG